MLFELFTFCKSGYEETRFMIHVGKLTEDPGLRWTTAGVVY